MEFAEILEQVIALLQHQGRLSYGALKRRLKLDDDYLEDLKIELIEAQRLAVDENGRILVWIGDQGSTPLPALQPVTDTEPAPVSYTPLYRAEKILASRSALEGERKQVTVLFADIKDSTELIRDLDPEAAPRCPTARRRPMSPYSNCSSATVTWRITTTTAPSGPR